MEAFFKWWADLTGTKVTLYEPLGHRVNVDWPKVSFGGAAMTAFIVIERINHFFF